MLQQLPKGFEEKSDPLNASKQMAYMKNRFTFFLNATERRAIQREVFKIHPINTEEKLMNIVLLLYQQEEREFHYAAIDLCQKYRKCIHQFEFIKRLITTHSWWDSVDLLASNLLGFFLKENSKYLKIKDEWIRSKNLWIRRSALIFQLKWKEETDVERLFSYCQCCGDERKFFIEKVIGWALRELSKTNPKIVKQFVIENEKILSFFTKKEACKLIS